MKGWNRIYSTFFIVNAFDQSQHFLNNMIHTSFMNNTIAYPFIKLLSKSIEPASETRRSRVQCQRSMKSVVSETEIIPNIM